MKNDHEIREFFHANRPEIGGEDAFLKKLDDRLAVAEQVRGYCKSERKRSRRGIVIASTVGLLCGIGLMLMLIYLPSVLDPSTVIAEAAEDCSVKVSARRRSTMMEIVCRIGGFVVVECDRCLDDLPLKVDVERMLTVGFGAVDVDDAADEDDDGRSDRNERAALEFRCPARQSPL